MPFPPSIPLRPACAKAPTPLRWWLAVSLVLFALLLPATAAAQTVRGTISGSVLDESGATIPGAEVRLVDLETGRQERVVLTADDGRYRLIEIEPGNYRIQVSMMGFTDASSEAFTLETNRNVRLDVTLSVSGGAEVITVTAGTELIDRESATLGTTVEHKRVEGLPLNGRNVLNLALLQPGVNSPLDDTDFGTGLNLQVNGQRGTENNLSVDGANNNEVAVGGGVGVLPPPDAVEEFRVLTSNFEAEFGRNTGSIINVVTRSGAADYHGNVRFFFRPTVLSAARYFDKALATPEQAGEDLRRQFERKEFGGNFGGPVRLPGLYDGSDRTFFFFDYEGRRQLLGDTQTVTGLPSAAERAGDFSSLPNAIFDPVTGQPFPGNIIPSERISPIAKFYIPFLPAANQQGQAVVSASETTNFDQFTFRFDHSVNDRQTLTYSFGLFDRELFDPFAFGGSSVPGFGSLDLRKTQNHTVRHTWVLNPTIVNSLQFGYARNNQPGVAPDNDTDPVDIGFSGDFTANGTFAGPPFIRFFDRNFTMGNSIQGPQRRVSENFQMQESMSWATGAHRLKFGFDGTFHKQDQTFLFINQGLFTFSGRFGGNTTGDDFADLLIGTSPIAAQFGSNGLRDYRQWATAWFVQDNWQISSRLTLSLGLRWEYTSPLTDTQDRVAYHRAGAISQRLVNGELTDPATGAPITIPPGGRAPLGLVYPGDPDPVLGGVVPRGGIAKDYNNFAPRLGLAWSPTFSDGFLGTVFGNRTVVRAGWGTFYGSIVGDTALQQLSAPGYNGTNAFFFPGSGTLADPFAPDPFPDYNGDQGQLPNPFAATSIQVTAPLSQMSRPIDPFIRTPYTYQYNVTIERGFADDYVLSIGYVGNRSRKLYAIEQINPALGTFIPANREIPVPDATNTNSRRRNDDFRLGLAQQVAAGNSWYNAFQFQVQKRFAGGLSFQTAYTWSKTITDIAGFASGAGTAAGNHSRGRLDLLDRSASRGLALEDVPHRFVASWIWELPWARNFDGPLGVVLDGWSFGGIATFASGRPFNITNRNDTTGDGGATISFADHGSERFAQIDPRQNDSRAFNAGAFSNFGDSASGFVLATDFRRGTLGATQFRLANGANNFDFIVKKETPLWSEESRLELRFEFFNAFNRAQFLEADLNLLSDSFGKFTSTRESRVIQLGARISF